MVFSAFRDILEICEDSASGIGPSAIQLDAICVDLMFGGLLALSVHHAQRERASAVLRTGKFVYRSLVPANCSRNLLNRLENIAKR